MREIYTTSLGIDQFPNNKIRTNKQQEKQSQNFSVNNHHLYPIPHNHSFYDFIIVIIIVYL